MSKRNDDKAEDETEDKAMTEKAAQPGKAEKTTKATSEDTVDETAGSKAENSALDSDEVKYSVVFDDDEDDSIIDLDDTSNANDDGGNDIDVKDETKDDDVEDSNDSVESKTSKSSAKSSSTNAKASKAVKNDTSTKSKAKSKNISGTKPKSKPEAGDKAASKNAKHVKETLKLRSKGNDGLSSHEARSATPEPATVISSKIDKAEAADTSIRLKPNPTFGFDHVTLRNRKTGRNALDNLNWSFFAGKLYLLQNADDEQRRAFLGASSGFLRLDIGQITVRSVSLNELEISEIRGHRVALLTQLHNVRGDLDALTNLTFTMNSSGRTYLKPVPVRARELLKEVGFDQATTGMPLNKLSELDQRRVAIARAIASEPTVIIADDPAGGLEPEDRTVVLNLLRKLAHSRDPKYCVIVLGPMLGSEEADAEPTDGKSTGSEPTLSEAYLAAADKTYEF